MWDEEIILSQRGEHWFVSWIWVEDQPAKEPTALARLSI